MIEQCKVVIYNYILCWLYSMTKSLVIALIYFLVLWDFIVLSLVLSLKAWICAKTQELV